MHMYSLYVSKPVLVASFDLASESVKVLHVVDFQPVICIIIPNAQGAQHNAYMGVRVGISAK